jgi:hypothetical protein
VSNRCDSKCLRSGADGRCEGSRVGGPQLGGDVGASISSPSIPAFLEVSAEIWAALLFAPFWGTASRPTPYQVTKIKI